MLTHTAYDDIGGVEKALARHAEREFERLSPEEQEQAQRIFTQLVRPGEGTEDTRRIATRADVGKENWELITKLADARLVVTGGSQMGTTFRSGVHLEETGRQMDATSESEAHLEARQMDATSESEAHLGETVEVVHEALITGWQRLREWIDADREFRTWQERLRFAMRQWIASNHDEGALLRGAPLAEAEGWLEQRGNDLSQGEQHFIEAGLQNRNREFAEREAQRQRELEMSKKLAEEQRQRADEQAQAAKKLRSRLVFAVVLVVIAVTAAIGAFYGFKQANEQTKLAQEKTDLAEKNLEFANQQKRIAEEQTTIARKQKEFAQQERDKALRTQSLFLADLAWQQREAGDVTTAILLALKALPEDISNPDRPYVSEAEIELIRRWLVHENVAY